MTEQEAAAQMRVLAERSHEEITVGTHEEADELIIKFLRAQGYNDLADAYRDVQVWYG